MSHVDSMVLVVLGTCGFVVEVLSVIPACGGREVSSLIPRLLPDTEMERNGKIATADVLLMPWGLVMWTNLRTSP